jgi:phosphate transport system permease protein
MPVTTGIVSTKDKERIAKSVRGTSRDTRGLIFVLALLVALAVTLMLIVILLLQVLTDGWSTLASDPLAFLQGTLRSRSDDPAIGVSQGLYGSFWIAVFVAVLAFPTGIAAAVYLEEYAKKNRFTNFLELLIRNLAGVPSVVYGLLGLSLFVEDNWFSRNITGGRSLVSAGLTLAILVLPVVIITSQEAIRSVPSGLKEGGYGVGATKWDVIRSLILPYGAPGILTGTLLSMSRAIGEAAPLILVGAVTGGMTANPSLWDVSALKDRFTAMPTIIQTWTQSSGRDAGFAADAAAAIIVLLALVLLLNVAAILLRNRYERKRSGA